MPPSTLPTSRSFITNLINSLPALPPRSANATNNAAPNPLYSAPESVKKQLFTLHVLFPNEFLPALDLLDRHLVTRFRIRKEPAEVNVADPNEGSVAEASTLMLSGENDAAQAQAEATDERSALSPITAATGATGKMDVTDAEMREPLGHLNDDDFPPTAREELDEHCDANTVYYVRSAQHRSSRYSTSYDNTTSYEVRLNAWNCSCPAFAFAAFPSIHPEPPVPRLDNQKSWQVNSEGEASVEDDNERGWLFGGMSLGEDTPPVCKHLLACVLAERCKIFEDFVEIRDISIEEAAGWAAGWGD
ncbi:hypothetical protein K469DRAFT_690522 [Zopfia rhizophila CBS 207.26]|uniref:SWIM-type domain-containing protein n=1 Tax=Zopfia rhizophila CBS 207.26 TaxID=1314779 RepID=A0A6A6DT00_9PEZI|nr:hypothetical protein K469DRAFT_690522 [Zopfia rhizophila CBS 207.26]